MLTKVQKLKIKILATGIRVTDRARKAILTKYNFQLTDFEHHSTTSGIIIILPGNIYVNARINQQLTSIIKLDYDEEIFSIKAEKNKYSIKIVPPPSYIHQRNSKGICYKKAIMTHGDRIRISPIVGCAFKCKYCDIHHAEYQKIPLDFLLEGIELALAEKSQKPRHLLISGGTPKTKDRLYLDNIYRAVSKFCQQRSILVDIMLAPRKEDNFLENLKKAGIYSLSINLEIYNTEIAQKLNPQKFAISRDFYFEFISKAIKIFGKGKVRSLLILGLEPFKDTLAGVEALAQIGCDVVLSPFIPYEKTLLFKEQAPRAEELEEIFLKSLKIVNKYDVKIGPRCEACQHNTLAFPGF